MDLKLLIKAIDKSKEKNIRKIRDKALILIGFSGGFRRNEIVSLNIDDLDGAVFLPKDGQTNPIDVTQAMAKGAKMRGAKIFENIKVTGIIVNDGHVTGVKTVASGPSSEENEEAESIDISAEIVVNCAGLWGRQVGMMAGVHVPLCAAEHFYIVTDDIGLPPTFYVERETSFFITSRFCFRH